MWTKRKAKDPNCSALVDCFSSQMSSQLEMTFWFAVPGNVNRAQCFGDRSL